MRQNLKTARLELTALGLSEAAFIHQLVNTPGWLRFIGDRNIGTIADALGYIEKILFDPNVHFWIVKLSQDPLPTDQPPTDQPPAGQPSIGIITLIQRDYLEHPDIGFAFLPAYAKQGYAFEAAAAVMQTLTTGPDQSPVLAITKKENADSARLLEKLGLRFDREINNKDEALQLYSTAKLLLSSPTGSLKR